MVLVLCSVAMGALWWRPVYLSAHSSLGSGSLSGLPSGLAQWKDRHYTILATEAGVIPYFSQWRAIDGWGLNDEEIVHNPKWLTDDYIDQNQPEVIMFYMEPHQTGGMDRFNAIWRGDPPVRQDISQLVAVMSHYAVTHGYELAARWGANRCGVQVWYVKRGLPESQEMVDLIRRKPYFDPYARGLAENFLDDGNVECDDIDLRIDSRQ